MTDVNAVRKLVHLMTHKDSDVAALAGELCGILAQDRRSHGALEPNLGVLVKLTQSPRDAMRSTAFEILQCLLAPDGECAVATVQAILRPEAERKAAPSRRR